VDAPLESLVGALAGVDLAVHFLCDVHPELQRGDRAAPETRLGRVINACGSGKGMECRRFRWADRDTGFGSGSGGAMARGMARGVGMGAEKKWA